jgi:predicted nuclease with TOPRIM domain
MTDDQPTITVSEGGFELPVVEVLTGRGVVFGKSGSGKSNSIGVIVEELLAQGYPLCIVDADGEHYGLKEEYELLHVGGDESVDVQVTPDHAEPLAEIMLHEDVPVILDISGYIDDTEAHELVERVVAKLFSMEKKTKKPFPVLIEEIHELVPETKNPSSVAKTLIRVAKRGRKHGLGVIGASQRPAEVKKSFVTQASWSIWHKLEWSQDTGVVKEVINKQYSEAVQDLDAGEAIVNADWMDAVRTVQFKRKHTFDAGATPGLDEFETPKLKGVSDAVVNRLQSITSEKAETETKADELEAEIADLRRQKESLEQELDDARSEDVGDSKKVSHLKDRIDTIRDERDSLKTKLTEVREARNDLQIRVKELNNELQQATQAADDLEVVREHLQLAAEAAGVTGDLPQDKAELHDRIVELEDANEELRNKLANQDSDVIVDGDYFDFIEQPPVQEAIADAKDESLASPSYVRGVIAAIIENDGPVTYADVADRLDLSGTTNVSKAVSTLDDFNIVSVDKTTSPYIVDLNVGGLEDTSVTKKRQERTSDVMDQI